MTDSPLTVPHPDDTPPVLTDDDMHQLWITLMGELGFGSRQLWFLIVDADGLLTPVLSRIDDLPAFPDHALLKDFFTALAEVNDDPKGERVGFLLARPGAAALTASDRAWLRTITTAAGAAGLDTFANCSAGDDLVIGHSHPNVAA